MSANTPEPKPQPNDNTAIWDLVQQDVPQIFTRREAVRDGLLADMHARDVMGLAKYGVRLQASNGRNPVVDAYQEALDLCAYLKQAKEEGRNGLHEAYVLALKVAYRLKYDLMRQDGLTP